jgi:hypothetical protein
LLTQPPTTCLCSPSLSSYSPAFVYALPSFLLPYACPTALVTALWLHLLLLLLLPCVHASSLSATDAAASPATVVVTLHMCALLPHLPLMLLLQQLQLQLCVSCCHHCCCISHYRHHCCKYASLSLAPWLVCACLSSVRHLICKSTVSIITIINAYLSICGSRYL